jgi:hypothetical protein
MLDTILKLLYSERLDKQIVKRLPYFLFSYLIMYFVSNWIGYFFSLMDMFKICVVSFILFVLSNAYFNISVNDKIKNAFDYKDFPTFIEKISKIFDGVSSINKDVDISKSYLTVFVVLFAGIMFFIFNISILTLIFYHLRIDFNIHIILLIITSFYVYQDLTKIDIYDEASQPTHTSKFITDLMEMYTVSNTLKAFPFSSVLQILLYLALRTFSPLLSISLPKVYSRHHILYRFTELNDFFDAYLNKKSGLVLREIPADKGMEFSNIRDNDAGDNLSTIFEQSPKMIFPYLYQTKLSDKGKYIKYTIFQVLKIQENKDNNQEQDNNIEDKDKGTVLGYIFIHLFNGSIVVRKLRGKHGEATLKSFLKKWPVYSIFLVGERNSLQYIESLMNTNTQPVPPSFMNIEADD